MIDVGALSKDGALFNAAGMGTSYVANTSANLLVNNIANANNVNFSMASMTKSYGDQAHIEALLMSLLGI